MTEAIHYQTIGGLQEQIRSGTVSPVDVVHACLARIHKHNPSLNAFITVFDDDARALARQAEAEIEAGRWKGPLHGIPVGIKDFYDTAGSRTTAAFEHFKNRIPKKDAVGVAKLKAAGAIVVGKTNMHRLGMGTTGLESAFGPVRNPWNGDYIPGGSSSGSAAAIAAGLCYATLDTDAIGSCRLPAACCGVVGFKATYGLISGEGNGPLQPLPRQTGCLAVGDDPFAIDAALSWFMGFDPRKIPVLSNRAQYLGPEWGDFDLEQLKVELDGVPIRLFDSELNFRFAPAPGWRGHIERS